MKGIDCKLPMQEDYRCFSNNGKTESSTKHKKLFIATGFLLLITLSIVIGFTFRSLTEISELRQEIELLKASFETLPKKVVIDHFDTPEYGEEPPGLLTPNSLDGDTVYDDEYYDMSYDDDVTADDDYLDSDTFADDTSSLLTGDQFTKDAKEATAPPRTKRNIDGHSQEITINADLYEETRRRNRTTRKNHQRQFTTSSPISLYSQPYYQQLRTQQDAGTYQTTSVPGAQLKSGDFNYQGENPDVEFTVVTDDQRGSKRTRHRQRRVELEERPVITGRMRPLPTAHFSGDTSKYVYGTHENYDGNGRLRHHKKTFVDWAPSSWFEPLGMDQHFSLSDGILTVKETGLYFIYAQIYYVDEHDITGFRVYKNESDTILQCTTMTHTANRIKGNSCYTAAAEYLEENDRISIGDIEQGRYSLFQPGKSFFGVIKLGDVRIR